MKIKQKQLPYRNFITKNNKDCKLDKKKKYKQTILQKPFGIWYAIRHYWIEIMVLNIEYEKINYVKEEPNKIYNLLKYTLCGLELKKGCFTDLRNPNKDKILKIDRYNDMVKF